jgi:transcriptional antiterminator NusG|tara:strand:+ start:3561 stop:4319 length:759 start_codon:yes stop_codon:yes gene_type:complete
MKKSVEDSANNEAQEGQGEPVLFQSEPDIPEEEAKEYEKEAEEKSEPAVEEKKPEPEAEKPEPKKEKTEPEEDDDAPAKKEDDHGIYAIRTTANKEKNVASKLYDRITRDGYDIQAIVVPGLKGYLLVEGSRQDIDKAYRGVTHARGLVSGKTGLDEIGHFLAPKPAVTALAVDYIVEVSAGPFKGEKAKITRVDNTKNEITIELLEATVPIPITVPAESVRVLEKDLDDKKAKAKEEAENDNQETSDPFKL